MKISLRLKMVIVIVSIMMLVASISIAISYKTYSETIDQYYKDTITNIANTAAAMMDADKLEQYYETLEKDEEYNQYLNMLYTIKENNNIKYLYIEKVVGNKAVAIMDADSQDTAMELGETFEVSDGADISSLENGIPAFISNEEGVGWVCSVFVPVKDSNGKVSALVGADISMEEVMAQRHQFLFIICTAIIVSAIISVASLLILVQRFVVHPINLLSKATSDFVCKDESGTVNINTDSPISKIKIGTRDEIETLSSSIKLMEQQIYQYIDNLTAVTAEKERIGAEMNVAKHIQSSMLPCIFPPFPDRKEFDIYATMTPAKEVGGDFYDFFLVDDNHLAMVIADVSGKGVPAALFMMISKTLLKSEAQAGSSPKEVLEKVNNQLCENNKAEMFVTVWMGILEISTGKISCANAGHEYPAVKRADGSFALLRDKHGFVLAGMEGMRYKEYEIELGKGDSIFVYTDGVTEATNEKNELYGTDRLVQALNRRGKAGCSELISFVHKDIEEFVGEAPQFDDITMLCLTMKD